MSNHHPSRSWRGCAVVARSSPEIESTPAVLEVRFKDHLQKIPGQVTAGY
jgi:hypothetical protein